MIESLKIKKKTINVVNLLLHYYAIISTLILSTVRNRNITYFLNLFMIYVNIYNNIDVNKKHIQVMLLKYCNDNTYIRFSKFLIQKLYNVFGK